MLADCYFTLLRLSISVAAKNGSTNRIALRRGMVASSSIKWLAVSGRPLSRTFRISAVLMFNACTHYCYC